MKRRTFIQSSAAAAAAISIGGCGSSKESTPKPLKVDARHKMNIHFKKPTYDIEKLINSLSPEQKEKAQKLWLRIKPYLYKKISQNSIKYFLNLENTSVMKKSSRRDATGNSENIFVSETEFSSVQPTVFYVTHPLDTPAEDGRDYGLTSLYLYVPSKEVIESARNDGTNIISEGDIHLGDPADETIKALLFMHPSISQLKAESALKILKHLDVSSLKNIYLTKFYLNSAMKSDSWVNATTVKKTINVNGKVKLSNEALTYSSGIHKGKPIYQFTTIEKINNSLAEPIQDLLTRIENDPELKDMSSLNSIAEDTVDSTPTLSQRLSGSFVRRAQTDNKVVLSNNAKMHGYYIENNGTTTYANAFPGKNYFPSDTLVANLRFKNYWRRHIAFYATYKDIDGNIVHAEANGKVGKDAWPYMANDVSGFSSNDEKYLMRLNGVRADVLGVPIEAYNAEDISIVFPNKASSVTISAATLGSFGASDTTMEALPVGMTVTFEFLFPTLSLMLGQAMKNQSVWLQVVASAGPMLAGIITDAVIKELANGGNSDENATTGKEFLKAAVNAGPQILMGILYGGVYVQAEIDGLVRIWGANAALSKAETALPIVGQVMLLVNIGVAAAQIAQSSTAIVKSPSVSFTELTRSHTVNIQILPDEKNFQFPENSENVTLLLKSPKGKLITEFTGTKNNFVVEKRKSEIVDQTLFAKGSANVTSAIFHTFKDVPEGGTLEVIALFSTKNGIVLGHVKGIIENVKNPTKAFRITQIKTELSNKSVYSHKRIIKYDTSGKLKWTETSTPPIVTNNLASDGFTSGQISQLLSIDINNKIGALGYSFTTEIDGRLKTIVKNVSAKFDAPTQGLKEHIYGDDANAFVLYNLMAEPKIENENFILMRKNNTYFAKSVSIDPDKNKFGISEDKNYGKFSVLISAAAYDPVNRIMAGIDNINNRLHILPLSEKEILDSDKSDINNVTSFPTTNNSFANQDRYEEIEDILSQPSVLAFSPAGRLFVVDTVVVGGIRKEYIRVFNTVGAPLSYKPFGSKCFKELKHETDEVVYLDISVDSEGYFFILKVIGNKNNPFNYKLDLYNKSGEFLAQTDGVAAHKMRADYWRNIYTLNYEKTTHNGHSEPTISIWVPPVLNGAMNSEYS